MNCRNTEYVGVAEPLGTRWDTTAGALGLLDDYAPGSQFRSHGAGAKI